MQFIVATNKPLTSLSSGYDLRVWHLCKALALRGHGLHQVIVPLALDEARRFSDGSIRPEQLFQSISVVDVGLQGAASVRRHLRWNEGDYLRLAQPALFRAAVLAVRVSAKQHGTNKVIAFGSNLAGVIAALPSMSVLFDVCDSVVLTKRREAMLLPPTGIRTRIQRGVDLWRWSRSEGSLPAHAKVVTTISSADTDEILRLAPGAPHVLTVPNGVAPDLEGWQPRQVEHKASVAFWGNLAFSPNASAIRYFYDQVFEPYLSQRGIGFCVVGRDAPEWLLRKAALNASVRVTGFLDDLHEVVGRYPVMVNPMVSGSGMKNKVLEAFALGVAVVSTPLGMESVEGAIPGVHYMAARSPAEFAAHVTSLLADERARIRLVEASRSLIRERYTWRTVAAKWVGLTEGL
jgi:glycosyltransferase involved in cell wall biosynthesis